MLLIASQGVFTVVKWLGALYLVYLGLELIVGSFRRNAEAEPIAAIAPIKFYRQGLVMQLANPKAILFFTVLLPQFINPDFPATAQFVVLGLVSIIVQGACSLHMAGWRKRVSVGLKKARSGGGSIDWLAGF